MVKLAATSLSETTLSMIVPAGVISDVVKFAVTSMLMKRSLVRIQPSPP